MVYCAALNCRNATSGASKNSSVTFHGFPLHNEPLLRQWLHNMGWDTQTPSKSQRLCSAHFEDSSFRGPPSAVRRIRRLLKGAVPSKFLLGEDGKWLVGTPRSFPDIVGKETPKRIRVPEEQWRVSEKYPNGTEGPTLEDWQNEFYKTILKENCGFLTTLGKDYPVPKSKILTLQVKDQQDLEGRKIPASLGTGHGSAVIRSQLQSGEGTRVHGSSSGGSQNLSWNVSGKGEPSESPQNSPNEANPMGDRGSSSFPAGGQPEAFTQDLSCQQSHPQTPEIPWFICTECGKSFARHTYLLRHQKIHSGLRPHTCTECGKGFLEKCRLIYHLRKHLHIIRVPNASLG